MSHEIVHLPEGSVNILGAGEVCPQRWLKRISL
jgi:hypothetical protein